MLAITRRPPLTRRALPVGYAGARSRAAGGNRRQLAPRGRRAQRGAVRLAPRSASRTAARPAARFSARLATSCLGEAQRSVGRRAALTVPFGGGVGSGARRARGCRTWASTTHGAGDP